MPKKVFIPLICAAALTLWPFHLSASTIPPFVFDEAVEGDAGNSTFSATDIGALAPRSTAKFLGVVGLPGDHADRFRFSISSSFTVDLDLFDKPDNDERLFLLTDAVGNPLYTNTAPNLGPDQFGIVAPGTYIIAILQGRQAGSYDFSINPVAATVPTPAAGVLLLAALGALAFRLKLRARTG